MSPEKIPTRTRLALAQKLRFKLTVTDLGRTTESYGGHVKENILIITFIMVASLFIGCETRQGKIEHAAKENLEGKLKHAKLLGKYFGVNNEGGDAIYVLQFDLYRNASGSLVGQYYQLCALYDSISDEVLMDHGNEKNLIDPDIFETVKPRLGKINNGMISGNNISFTTSFIKYSKEDKSAWKFDGRLEKDMIIGQLTMLFTPIYDEKKVINTGEGDRVQYFKKSFSFKKLR